jgi:hypothetical protein
MVSSDVKTFYHYYTCPREFGQRRTMLIKVLDAMVILQVELDAF